MAWTPLLRKDGSTFPNMAVLGGGGWEIFAWKGGIGRVTPEMGGLKKFSFVYGLVGRILHTKK